MFAFCLCFCALFCFFFVFAFFFFVLRFFVFSLVFIWFLHFSSSLFWAQEILVFSAHFQVVAVDCPSSSATGKTAKKLQQKEFRSDPVYTNPVGNFPSNAPFAKLRPNDPSYGLTNDTREDPTMESSRPMTKKNPPKYFDVMLPIGITN